jgi:formylmethanofuran dehydrogenase subunit E
MGREHMNHFIPDIWICSNCGEEFMDLADCANKKLLLCVYCEDERMQAEGNIE